MTSLSWSGFLLFIMISSLRVSRMRGFTLNGRHRFLYNAFLSSGSRTRSLRNLRTTVMAHTDTIYAISSGPIVKSGVAVVRLSGPSSYYCLETLLTKDSRAAPPAIEPRLASLRYLRDPISKEILDQSLVLWFPGPKSFTGEDVVELHLHGSRAVIKGVFEALEHLDDPETNRVIRPAGPGEFTRRAFENGRMDLTEVEGLSDLLDADTTEQRKQALKQMDGHLRKQYEAWREVLMTCLAHFEAVIDFGDDDREDDINDSALTALVPKVTRLRDELQRHLQDGRRGEIVREGVHIALVGPPNAGKSSLMNALARRPAAIVSPIAGTTRDVVEVRLELEGVPCIVSDTAGLRADSSDVIELEGMRRAREAFDRAQIKLFVVDGSDAQSAKDAGQLLHDLIPEVTKSPEGNNEDHQESLEDSVEDAVAPQQEVMVVLNKADLLPPSGAVPSAVASGLAPSLRTHHISCATGSGLAQLETALADSVKRLLSPEGSSSSGGASTPVGVVGTMITRERHRRHVKQCVAHLERFLAGRLPMDAAAEEIRLAMQELGKITGRVDVEELLDIIFRDFCIGK